MPSDMKLRQDIEAQLDCCANVDSRQIGVAVRNGIVSLSGQVGSYIERRTTEEAVQSIAGVKAVANDIVVEFPFGATHSDADIAAAAVEALKASASVPTDRIKVVVREGRIELQGQVSSWQQKSAAETAVMSLHGVKTLLNNILV